MTRAFEKFWGIGVKVPREGETESLLERDPDGADEGTWSQLSLRQSSCLSTLDSVPTSVKWGGPNRHGAKPSLRRQLFFF